MKIFVAGRYDYFRFAWQPAIDQKCVTYFSGEEFRKLSFVNKCRRRLEHLLSRLRPKLAADFEKRDLLRERFDIDRLHRSDELLWILYETNFLAADIPLLQYLKKTYPKSKFVLFFSNAIGSIRPTETEALLSHRDLFDLIYSFNELDVKAYGFRLFFDLIGDLSSVPPANCEPYDLLYVGRAKDRLDRLLSIASTCVDLGLVIRFFLVDVPKEKRTAIPGVTYCEYLPYLEMISYAKKARAILNVMQGVSSGLTLREEEAIKLNKVLITDSDYILHSEFYTESKVIPLPKLCEQVAKIRQSDPTEVWNTQVKADGFAFLEQVKQDLKSQKR